MATRQPAGEQTSLEGLAPPAQPTSRLFLAIFPDDETAKRVAELEREWRARCGLKGSTVPQDRLHVTLHHLGDHAGMRPDIVDAAIKAAATVDSAGFEMVFDRVISFDSRSGQRPFVLRAAETATGLIAFQRALGVALQKTILGRQIKASFTPHMTLAYDSQLVPEQAVETIRWPAREFVLVHSLIGKGLYVPLSRWSLRAGV